MQSNICYLQLANQCMHNPESILIFREQHLHSLGKVVPKAIGEQSDIFRLFRFLSTNSVTGNSPADNLPRPTLHRLPVEDLHRSTGPRVDFIVDHMLQALVVSRSDKDLCRHFATSEAVVDNLRVGEENPFQYKGKEKMRRGNECAP